MDSEVRNLGSVWVLDWHVSRSSLTIRRLIPELADWGVKLICEAAGTVWWISKGSEVTVSCCHGRRVTGNRQITTRRRGFEEYYELPPFITQIDNKTSWFVERSSGTRSPFSLTVAGKGSGFRVTRRRQFLTLSDSFSYVLRRQLENEEGGTRSSCTLAKSLPLLWTLTFIHRNPSTASW